MRFPGLPSQDALRRFRVEIGVGPRQLNLQDCGLNDRHWNILHVSMADSSCRGLGSCICLFMRQTCVGVSRTDFSSLHAAALLQSWKSRFDTQTQRGRSSMVFTKMLFKRFFQHLCGKSHYVSLHECLTALWSAKQSRGSLIRSWKQGLVSLR